MIFSLKFSGFARNSDHHRYDRRRFLPQQGYLLPTILGILVLVIFSSSHVGKLLFENYKTLNIKRSGDYSYDLALGALEAIEKKLATDSNQPEPFSKVDSGQDEPYSIFSGEVWATNLIDYKLIVESDPVSNKTLAWWQQPEDWWQAYAYEMTKDELGEVLLETGQAYGVVEYIGPYVFNQDLTQTSDTGGDISAFVYRITVAGFSSDRSKAVLSSTYVKTYVF